MGVPAIVMNDSIQGICPAHLMPGPSGTQPAGPLPFNAPITLGTIATVQIGGKPAAVMGSSGMNTMSPHVGIVDPPFAGGPAAQIGRILSGSTTVLIGGQPAATQSSSSTMCVAPGTLVPSVMTVLIG